MMKRIIKWVRTRMDSRRRATTCTCSASRNPAWSDENYCWLCGRKRLRAKEYLRYCEDCGWETENRHIDFCVNCGGRIVRKK